MSLLPFWKIDVSAICILTRRIRTIIFLTDQEIEPSPLRMGSFQFVFPEFICLFSNNGIVILFRGRQKIIREQNGLKS